MWLAIARRLTICLFLSFRDITSGGSTNRFTLDRSIYQPTQWTRVNVACRWIITLKPGGIISPLITHKIPIPVSEGDANGQNLDGMRGTGHHHATPTVMVGTRWETHHRLPPRGRIIRACRQSRLHIDRRSERTRCLVLCNTCFRGR